VLAANYVTSYSYQAGSTPAVLSHAFMFQIGLRTIAQSCDHEQLGRRRPVAWDRPWSARVSQLQLEWVLTADMTMTTASLPTRRYSLLLNFLLALVLLLGGGASGCTPRP